MKIPNEEKIKELEGFVGKTVEIISLCNEEEHYQPGDRGIVEMVDGIGQLHVRWFHGGSIGLLLEDKYKIID